MVYRLSTIFLSTSSVQHFGRQVYKLSATNRGCLQVEYSSTQAKEIERIDATLAALGNWNSRGRGLGKGHKMSAAARRKIAVSTGAMGELEGGEEVTMPYTTVALASRVLLRQPNHQFLYHRADARPANVPTLFRAVELVRDEPAIPGEDGVRPGHASDLLQPLPAESLTDLGHPPPATAAKGF
jgi:hypothetical protein